VQETYLRAWRAYERFEGRSSFRVWPHQIATNACLRAVEQRGRRSGGHKLSRVDDELTSAQFDALLAESGDREVLAAFLCRRIGQWPWWDSAWQVVEIREVRPRQITEWLHEVTVDGVIGRDAGETLPLSVFARVAGSRLDRFEVRVGDALIGPPIRHGDPHPFGSILSALMDRRGISRRDMARRCQLAESTVAKMRAGYLVPQREGMVGLAAALEMPVGDLLAVAGLPQDA
jgi:hypothetical protein